MSVADGLKAQWEQHGGNRLLEEPVRLRGLLGDLFPGQKREINLLVAARDAQVPQDLLAATASARSVKQSQLVKRLQTDNGLDADAAFWAVETWSHVLGIKPPKRTAPPPTPDEILQQVDGSVDFQNIIALLEPLAAGEGKLNGDVHLYLSEAYKEVGRVDDALAALRKCLLIDPAHLQPYKEIAILLKEKGDTAGAEAILRQAILAFHPSNLHTQSEINFELLTTLNRVGKNAEALPFAEAYYQAKPDDLKANYWRVGLLSLLDKHQEVVAATNSALKLKAQVLGEVYPRIRYYRGKALYHLPTIENNYAKAERSFRAAITHKLISDDYLARAYNLCAAAIREQNRLDEALQVAREGLARCPQNVSLADTVKQLAQNEVDIAAKAQAEAKKQFDAAKARAEAKKQFDAAKAQAEVKRTQEKRQEFDQKIRDLKATAQKKQESDVATWSGWFFYMICVLMGAGAGAGLTAMLQFPMNHWVSAFCGSVLAWWAFSDVRPHKSG